MRHIESTLSELTKLIIRFYPKNFYSEVGLIFDYDWISVRGDDDSAKFVIDYCSQRVLFSHRRSAARNLNENYVMLAQTKFSLNRQEEIIRKCNNTRVVVKSIRNK